MLLHIDQIVVCLPGTKPEGDRRRACACRIELRLHSCVAHHQPPGRSTAFLKLRLEDSARLMELRSTTVPKQSFGADPSSVCYHRPARFTNEGGFQAPEEYPWSPIAEEELADHLRKLMDAPHPFQSGS